MWVLHVYLIIYGVHASFEDMVSTKKQPTFQLIHLYELTQIHNKIIVVPTNPK